MIILNKTVNWKIVMHKHIICFQSDNNTLHIVHMVLKQTVSKLAKKKRSWWYSDYLMVMLVWRSINTKHNLSGHWTKRRYSVNSCPSFRFGSMMDNDVVCISWYQVPPQSSCEMSCSWGNKPERSTSNCTTARALQPDIDNTTVRLWIRSKREREWTASRICWIVSWSQISFSVLWIRGWYRCVCVPGEN